MSMLLLEKAVFTNIVKTAFENLLVKL